MMVNQCKTFAVSSLDAAWNAFKQWLQHHPDLEPAPWFPTRSASVGRSKRLSG